MPLGKNFFTQGPFDRNLLLPGAFGVMAHKVRAELEGVRTSAQQPAVVG
jgi:hypothetical protein